jgi:hypothetical protein
VTSPVLSPVPSGADADPGGTDPVARMIAARSAALLCSDAAEEIFPIGDDLALARRTGDAPYGAATHPA